MLIANDDLEVTINSEVGAAVTAITHRPTGMSILGHVPWEAVKTPLPSRAARDEPQWLTRYTGGWPPLFPNAGDACTFEGRFHGFHGEASIISWHTLKTERDSAAFDCQLETVPVTMRRSFRLDRDCLLLTESLLHHGSRSTRAMWGQHPTFGSDLLAGPVSLSAGNPRVTVDDSYDPAANPLKPGAAGQWPSIPGKSGPFDLSHPFIPLAALVYLHDFEEPWVELRRDDNGLAARLTWNPQDYPCVWLWLERRSTADAPWNGQADLIGIEPNTTRASRGLSDALARGADLLILEPGETRTTEIELRVYQNLA